MSNDLRVLILTICLLFTAIDRSSAGGPDKSADIAVTTPRGITARIHPDPSAPAISIAAYFRGGSFRDQTNGLSALTVSQILENPRDIDPFVLAGRMRQLGATYQLGAIDNYIRFQVTSPPDNIQAATRLAFDSLIKSPPQPKNVENALSFYSIASKIPQSDGIRALNFIRAQTMSNHPLYTMRTGSEGPSIGDLSPSALTAWHQAHFARDNLVIGIAGPIDAKIAVQLIDNIFASLPEKSNLPPPVPFAVTPTATIIHERGSEDLATIVIEAEWPADTDIKTSAAKDLLRNILVGEKYGRLPKLLQKVTELPLGVTSIVNLQEGGNLISFRSHVPQAKADMTAAEILKGLDEVSQSGVTADELKTAVTRMKESAARQSDQPSVIAAQLAQDQIQNLAIDFRARKLTAYEGATVGEVNALARTVLAQGKITTAILSSVRQ
jgi:zinc protease